MRKGSGEVKFVTLDLPSVGEGGRDFQNHSVEQAPSELLLKSLLDV